ncbi:MAG TPA: hypothetical protein P5525_26045 [Candidatus Paceibacterota bacterium]|nr:hypothetical protein [Candidatus Paceibacterota bacterium]
MTRSRIESAIESGAAFTLGMADGREYPVPHRDYISISPKGTFVTVYDDDERFVVLPLLTMTGLASTAPKHNGSSSKQ